MKKLLLLFSAILFMLPVLAQQSTSFMLRQPMDNMPAKRPVKNPMVAMGPKNNHLAYKSTSGFTTYSDWYDLWDEMFDTTSSSGPHSYQYLFEIYPDSNIYDIYGYYPAYNIFTHGLGMSFDPSDSAYFYHGVNPSYVVSAPFDYTQPYQLDSFWVPGQYMRYDPSATNVDSLIVEFLVTQNGGSPDSGAYALIATPADAMYIPCTADSTPRFGTPRYFRAQNECIDPALTTTVHRRYAFPLTSADAGFYRTLKFDVTPAITVPAHKYLMAYVYFKSQTAYTLGTINFAANYYWLYAGEPTGIYSWFPQSAHTTATGYPGSHQDGLIATNQIRYNDLGFTFNSHNVLIPSYAYAASGVSPGFDVPHMAFHITWVQPPPLDAGMATAQNGVITTFPNPANDILNVTYSMPAASLTTIRLINILGQEVASRDMGCTSAGKAVFRVADLPAGSYMCILSAGGNRNVSRVFICH